MAQLRVCVGMSGGVDSSVTAALLKEQGYDVTGVFIEAYNEPGCRTDQDKKDALQVALKLGIPFETLDVREEYKQRVVHYFLRTYERGATPNPDVVCNREVKFGLFYDWAMMRGYDAVATGHYARITPDGSVQRPHDLNKDQSYFLWDVSRDRLKNILWPLGSQKKEWVRTKAYDLNLPNADKPDSMGVCMMGELSVHDFLFHKLGEHLGDVIFDDHIVGHHRGLWFHTIGQRGGFDLDKLLLKKWGYHPETMEPLYVIAKDKARNCLIVGLRDQVMQHSWAIPHSRWFIDGAEIERHIHDKSLLVRIRNLGELYTVTGWNGTTLTVASPVFGVAEGQIAVFYARVRNEGEEVVVGGGEIGV